MEDIYRKLEVEGLIKKGLTFDIFVQAAGVGLRQAIMKRQFGGFFT